MEQSISPTPLPQDAVPAMLISPKLLSEVTTKLKGYHSSLEQVRAIREESLPAQQRSGDHFIAGLTEKMTEVTTVLTALADVKPLTPRADHD